jgi:multicomponent Na+:H+ antiporter subunit D
MVSITARFREVEPNSAILTATLIFVAFGIKVGLFPFHFWLPPVYRGRACRCHRDRRGRRR